MGGGAGTLTINNLQRRRPPLSQLLLKRGEIGSGDEDCC